MKITTRRLALCAVLTALALGLSTLEGMFPVSLLIPLPGIKLGLANIVTVYALYALGPASALAILLSLMGGGLSMLVMIVLRHLPRLSIYGVSIGGAAAHNIGQIGAAMIVLGGTAVLGYLPVLLAVSLLTGTLTGFVAGLLFRAMKNVKLSR